MRRRSRGDGLGATLAQGWLFGRREHRPGAARRTAPAGPTPPSTPTRATRPRSARLPGPRRRGRPSRTLLPALSRHLEDQARALGRNAILVGAFEGDGASTPHARPRYADLARELAFCGVVGDGDAARARAGRPRRRGRPAGDPLAREWTVSVVAPHFAAALVAHERPDSPEGAEPIYDYILTYDRGLATSVAAALTARVAA